jgi:single-stranded-DNA-specific exonuclease
VDCTVEPRNITLNEVRGLNALEPFGMGNAQPNFLMRNVRVEEITPISHDRHVKMLLDKDGRSFYGFAFGMGSRSCPFVRDDLVDLVFSAEINYYRGRESLQLVVRDVQWAPEEEAADREMLECFCRFMEGGPVTPEEALQLSPSKGDLVAVFRHVKANCEEGVLCTSARTLYRKVRYETGSAINLGKLLICLEVFNEFRFYDTQRTEDDLIITDLNFRGKTDINGSVLLRRLLERTKA